MALVRIVAAAALVCALSACPSNSASGDAGASASSPAATKTAVGSGRAPVARMQAGTDSAPGALLMWCEAKNCEAAHDATPTRSLRLAGRGVLYFTLGVKPDAVTVEVRDRRGRTVDKAALLAGTTTPAYAASLRAGRYSVVLSAGWAARRAKWVFGLTVPKRLE